MGILVLLLVAAWALVLGPALLQSTNSPMNTERMFRRSLRALGSNRRRGPAVLGGRNILVPPKPSYPLRGERVTALGSPVRGARASAAERRRKNLTYLAVFNIVTFLIGLAPPLRFLLVPHLVGDVLLILYLGLAVYMTMWPPQSERSAPHPPMDPATVTPQRAVGGGF